MNKKYRKLVFPCSFLFLLLTPIYTYADLTGKDLLENCEKKITIEESKSNTEIPTVDAFQYGACTGYIKGFDDMEILYSSIIAGPNSNETEVKKYALYCVPSGTTNLEMAKVIVKYLKSHPQALNQQADISVVRAMRAAFPCKKNEKGQV